MKLQPLKAVILAVVLNGCASMPTKETAPVTPSLHSEYSYVDDESSFYGPFVAATEALHNERHQASATYYLKALSLDPDSQFVADRAFFQLLFSGHMDNAAELAVTICENPEDEPDDLVHLMCVLEAYKRADWPVVRARLASGMSTGFGYIIAPLLEAWTYGAEGDMDAVEVALKPLYDDKRFKSIAEEHTAYILDHIKRYDQAEQKYQSLVSLQPTFSLLQPIVTYAYMLNKTGQTQKARDFLAEKAKKYNNHRVILREGEQILRGGKPVHQADTPNGAAGMVFYRLASEFSQNGSKQTAVVYLRLASYLRPEVADFYFMLGSLLSELDKYKSAAIAYNSVLPTSSLRDLADVRRIEVLKFDGQLDLAEELVRDTLMNEPEDYEMLMSLADILQRKEQFDASLEFYNKALMQIEKPQPHNWYAYFARGVSYERSGNWLLAERDLKLALSLSENQPAVLNYLGYSWIDRGENIEEAKAMIKAAVEAQPDDGFIVDSLGWVHYLTGDFETAVDTLEKAVRLEPGDATINDHLGDAYWRVGRKTEARFQWRHALEGELKPDERRAIMLKLEDGLPDIQEKS